MIEPDKTTGDHARTTNILLGIIAAALLVLVAFFVGPVLPWRAIFVGLAILGGIVAAGFLLIWAVVFVGSAKRPFLAILSLFLAPWFGFVIFPLWYGQYLEKRGQVLSMTAIRTLGALGILVALFTWNWSESVDMVSGWLATKA